MSDSPRRRSGTPRPAAEQACRECRRRKSKCNRVIPSCLLCVKFDRRCIYEKHSKTPLTRRYLTEVEEELARTKAQLQQALTRNSGHDASLLSRDFAEPRLSLGEVSHEQVSEVPSVGLPGPRSRGSHESPLSYRETLGEVDRLGGMPGSSSLHDETHAKAHDSQTSTLNGQMLNSLQSAGTERRLYDRPPNPDPDTHSVSVSGLSMETPPSSGNFEWDERTGKANGDKFVDGMASLTSRSNEGGYLGVASGAALLRMTDSRSTDGVDTYGAEQSDTRYPNISFVMTALSQLEPFVDAYFRLYHCSYPIIHEATFRAQFMEVIPRPSNNAWQVLLFVVAALGAWTTAAQPTDVDVGLFQAAKARLSIDVLETGSLLLVQALALISNYLQKRNKPNSGYNYMGLARRIAMGIGLHKEFPTWETSLLNIEMRRRVFYCLYIFDIGGIITFSRPFDFPDDGVDAELPMNVHDSDITAATKRTPQPTPETTVYTHLRAQATFHMATSQIYSKIISTPFPSATELMELDDRLIGHWLTDLPAFFQEDVQQVPKFTLCHSILRWRYRNFRILMYRPFLVGRLMVRAERETEDANAENAIRRCLQAARESVELISAFWAQDQKSMMACWYGLYFLFQAILIPVICLRNDPQCGLAVQWRDQIYQAMAVLESMAPLNPTALRCLGVIRSLCGTYLDPDDGLGHPTEESPQTQLANLYPLMWPTLEMSQVDGVDSIMQESTILDFMNQLPGFE